MAETSIQMAYVDSHAHEVVQPCDGLAGKDFTVVGGL